MMFQSQAVPAKAPTRPTRPAAGPINWDTRLDVAGNRSILPIDRRGPLTDMPQNHSADLLG